MHLIGYIHATFSELLLTLGQPEIDQDPESQVKWERDLSLTKHRPKNPDTHPFTVYDKLEGVPPERITLWHVSAADDSYRPELEKLLNKKIHTWIWELPA